MLETCLPVLPRSGAMVQIAQGVSAQNELANMGTITLGDVYVLMNVFLSPSPPCN